MQTYRSLMKNGPVSNICPPPIIASISIHRMRKVQLGAKLVYSYTENDVI